MLTHVEFIISVTTTKNLPWFQLAVVSLANILFLAHKGRKLSYWMTCAQPSQPLHPSMSKAVLHIIPSP